MKKHILISVVFAFLFILTSTAYAESSDNMTVKVDVIKPNIGITVPSLVTFQEISTGYLSERQDLSISNTGTVDVQITPEISSDYNGSIFQNIAFKETLDDPLIKLGNYVLELLKPTEVGGTRTEKVYMYLDLTSYSGTIEQDMLDHKTQIIFWATPL